MTMIYFDTLQEISEQELLEGLLGYGLIAEKIPNFLTSESFYDFFVRNNKPKFEQKERDYIRYESMRNENTPRSLAVPNPFAYANLCNEIATNWNDILSHFESFTKDETHKTSRIHIRKLKDKKHLFEMNYKNSEKDGTPEQKLRIRNRFRVVADISSCFPSIYSHSVPWALIGKDLAKRNRDDKNLWFNRFDLFIRNLKNGETNGLLIGPHSSNLIAEIILTRVDSALINRGYKYIRNIDDYTCYTKTYEEAESFLLDLSIELKKYELRLNDKKTRIASLPKSSITNWVNKLNNFSIGEDYTQSNKQIFKVKKLKSFMDLAIENMLIENDSAVLNYAMKVVSTKYLGTKALTYYIDFVHHLVLLYPYLILILENHVFEPFKIDKDKIQEIANDIYELGIDKRFFEACSYSLFFSLKYGFNLDKDFHKDTLESSDCIFMLLGFLLARKDRDKATLKVYYSKALELRDKDFDRFWLFNYECLKNSDLTGDFKRLKKEKVSFIRSEFL